MSILNKFKKPVNKKNKKNQIEEVPAVEVINAEKPDDGMTVLERGQRSFKDLIAPSVIDRSDPTCLQVGGKKVRSYMINGYPPNGYVGWLDDLINYDGDMDTAIYIEPTDKRDAIDEISQKITQYQTQLELEKDSGKHTKLTYLNNIVRQLYAERERLEKDQEKLFYAQIFSNLYANDLKNLNKRHDMLMNQMKGRNISLMPAYLNQDDSYKCALPFAKIYTPDRFRSLNSGAVTSLFPFYNSEISHENGIFLGINMDTSTPVIMDFYNSALLGNANFTVFAKSGAGKTYNTSLITIRSAIQGIHTVIIDPEGEYLKLTDSMGGSYIKISPSSETKINPFDLEEEDETDDFGTPTGRKIVRVKDKVADVLNLIGVMNGGLSREQESLTSAIIADVYKNAGFTDDINSLYVIDAYFDEGTDTFYHSGEKKPMPTFSDFHALLVEYAKNTNNSDLVKLANALLMFRRDGVYGMFDCQTSVNIDFKNSPIITFDISDLEDGTLRPIGMYVSLTWTWEKFIKKNPEIQKRVLVDEAWMLVKKEMKGHEYTAAFLDKAARRIRKRNAGLVVVSQNFIEFEKSEQGKAVLTNSSVNIFLAQSDTDIAAVQRQFNLSDGESMFLTTAKRGEALIKMGSESSRMYVLSFPHEHNLIKKETAKSIQAV